MNFNSIVNYILRNYTGQVNRSFAGKIAARLLDSGAYNQGSSDVEKEINKEVNMLIRGLKKDLKVSSRDFIKGGKKSYKQYSRSYLKRKAAEEEESQNAWEIFKAAEEGNDDVYTREIDAVIDSINDVYSGTKDEVIENQDLLVDILNQARDLFTDEYIYYILKKTFPDYKKRLKNMANSIYDDYYGKDGRGKGRAFKRDVLKLMRALGVEDSEHLWWANGRSLNLKTGRLKKRR